MTHRERLIGTYRHKKIDRMPDYEMGAWIQTIERWHKEGLPAKYIDRMQSINDFFNTDIKSATTSLVNINIFLEPGFDEKVLEEKDTHIVKQDTEGAIVEMLRPELGASIPRYFKYAIETRKDWKKLRDERLNPDSPSRIPNNLDELCKNSFTSTEPISLRCGSLYGRIRNWMGVENLSIAIYDDPEWVEEMMEYLTQLMFTLYKKIAGKCKIDEGIWWEDMCYNKGPLISPKLFHQWMVPRYKRITDFLRNECGCEFNRLDSDGNIHELVEGWLEGGINVMFPIEVAHTDAYKISKQFGKRVSFRGGFNKLALIAGKEAIDKEFERLTPLLKQGGFIPHTDHLVPPDVSFENYKYYRQKKSEFIGKK